MDAIRAMTQGHALTEGQAIALDPRVVDILLYIVLVLIVAACIWVPWMVQRGRWVSGKLEAQELIRRSDDAAPDTSDQAQRNSPLPLEFAGAQQCVLRNLRDGYTGWVCVCEVCRKVRADLIRRKMERPWVDGVRRRMLSGIY